MELNKAELKALLSHASTDATRVNLRAVYVDPSHEAAATTDGHRLFCLETGAKGKPNGTSRGYELDDIKRLIKVLGNKDAAKVSDDGATMEANGLEIAAFEADGCRKLPPVEQVFPCSVDEAESVRGVNAKYLMEAARALTPLSPNRTHTIRVQVSGALDPILMQAEDIDTDRRYSIIVMPMRI